MIPDELVKTRLDARVNRAYELARERGAKQYVWCKPSPGDEAPIYISRTRPESHWTDGWCIMVDPAGFAMHVTVEEEEP